MDGTERKPSLARRIAIAALAAVVLGLVAWVWLDARERIGATQEELARRLRDIEADARDARSGKVCWGGPHLSRMLGPMFRKEQGLIRVHQYR